MWGRIGLLALAGFMAISAIAIGAPALADDAPANVTDVPTTTETAPVHEPEPVPTPAAESAAAPPEVDPSLTAVTTVATATYAVARTAPTMVIAAAIADLAFLPSSPRPYGLITVTGSGCDPSEPVLIRTSIPSIGSSSNRDTSGTAAADGTFSITNRLYGHADDTPAVSRGTQFSVAAYCGGVVTSDADRFMITFGTLANSAPSAGNDYYVTAYESPLELSAPGLLVNDSDRDGDTVTAHEYTGPAHGTLSNFFPDGSFTYTPNAGFSGTDTFFYYAWDGTDPSADTPVSIIVAAAGGPPVAVADNYTTPMDTPLDVALADGLLVNDSEPDGEPMRVCLATSTQPTHGTLTYPSNDGRFLYVPDAGFNGVDTWTYHAGDPTFCGNFVTVTVTVGDVVPDPDPDPAGSAGSAASDSGDADDDSALPDTGAPAAIGLFVALAMSLFIVGGWLLRRGRRLSV